MRVSGRLGRHSFSYLCFGSVRMWFMMKSVAPIGAQKGGGARRSDHALHALKICFVTQLVRCDVLPVGNLVAHVA